METPITDIAIKKKLFTIIRRGMGMETEHISLCEAECEAIIHFAKRQSITPIIWNGLRTLDIDSEWLEPLEKAKDQCAFQFVLRDQAMKQIADVLTAEHIAYIPLKGAVLCDLYPEAWMRTCCDIDVLVHKEDLDCAVESLQRNTGFRALKTAYHDISMSNRQVHLELHFSMKVNREEIDALLEKAWDFALPIAEARYSFTHEYLVFHIIAHMCQHFRHGGLGIRPFIDLWLLRNKTSYDEKIVEELCASCGILAFYRNCSKLVSVWLDGMEYDDITAKLEEICFLGGVFGSRELYTAARQREKRRLGYIVSRIFIPSYELREYYSEEVDEGKSDFYFQVKRWKSWFSRDRRTDLFNQIKSLGRVDDMAIDDIADIFEKMEL